VLITATLFNNYLVEGCVANTWINVLEEPTVLPAPGTPSPNVILLNLGIISRFSTI